MCLFTCTWFYCFYFVCFYANAKPVAIFPALSTAFRLPALAPLSIGCLLPSFPSTLSHWLELTWYHPMFARTWVTLISSCNFVIGFGGTSGSFVWSRLCFFQSITTIDRANSPVVLIKYITYSLNRSMELIKRITLFFYLQVFSSTEFRLSPVPVPYTVEKQVRLHKMQTTFFPNLDIQ